MDRGSKAKKGTEMVPKPKYHFNLFFGLVSTWFGVSLSNVTSILTLSCTIMFGCPLNQPIRF